MNEIDLRDIEKYYGAHHLLKGVTFKVQTGDRVGLLGKNGTGKTTLFNILTGVSASDAGEKIIRRGAVASVLEQIPNFPDSHTAYDVLCSAYGNLLEIKAQMTALEQTMADRTNVDDILQKYGRLQQLFESQRGYAMEENISRVCAGLGLSPELLATAFSVLSGGEKTQVMLGRLLLKKADILLLDEPTNHLDVTAIEWLEGFLCEYKGTVIVISHDRYFLDQVVTRVVELVDGKAELYEGNYSYFAAEKEARYRRQQERFTQEQKKIKQMETAAKRMHEWARRADNPSMHKRAFNMEKRIERMEKTERPWREERMKKLFTEHAFCGQEVLVARELSKNFGGDIVLNCLDFTLCKGERAALLGANGSGKSTLLKIIAGEIASDTGVVRLGASIRYAYLPQMVTFAQPKLSVLDTTRYELNVSDGEARCILAKYRFRGEDVYRMTGNLSGGEKSRLRLCLLMQSDVNLLLLDEPTNHLDIDSREWLETALSEFNGTVLFVSHDRYFIGKFATQIWELVKGSLTVYLEDYDYYRQKRIARQQRLECQPTTDARSAADIPKSFGTTTTPHSARNNFLTEKAALEIQRVENAIQELEAALITLDARMQLCGSDFVSLEPLLWQKEVWENERDALYRGWLATNHSAN